MLRNFTIVTRGKWRVALGAAAWVDVVTVTALPAGWLLLCTLSAGIMKLISDDPKIGFIAHAAKFEQAIVRGELLAPAKSMGEMRAILFNDRVDAGLILLFILVLLSILYFGLRSCRIAWKADHPLARELPGEHATA